MIDSETPPDEIAKHSHLLQFSKLFVRLLKAITPNETFIYSDNARDLYLSLKQDVTFFANAIEQDYEEDSALGIRYFTEDELPADLSPQLPQAPGLGKFLSDVDQVERCVDELEDSIASFLVEPSPFLLKGIIEARTCIEYIERNNGVRLRIQNEKVESTIQGITLESIQNDVTFSYVEDSQIKDLLITFLEEVLITFRSKAFRSCVVLQRAIIEAILIYALNQDRNAAMKEFETLNQKRPVRDGRRKSIDWWELMDLVDVSRRLGILKTSRIGDDCHEFNAHRNTIHIFNKNRLRISEGTCLLGFYCLRVVNDNISTNLKKGI